MTEAGIFVNLCESNDWNGVHRRGSLVMVHIYPDLGDVQVSVCYFENSSSYKPHDFAICTLLPEKLLNRNTYLQT